METGFSIARWEIGGNSLFFFFFFFFYKTAWIKKSEEWLTPENATRESNTNFRSVFLFLEESVAIWENPRVGGTALARKQQDAF